MPFKGANESNTRTVYPLVTRKLGGKALVAESSMAEGARDDVISMVGTLRACPTGTLRKACYVEFRRHR